MSMLQTPKIGHHFTWLLEMVKSIIRNSIRSKFTNCRWHLGFSGSNHLETLSISYLVLLGHDEVVELLINHGANINVGDLNGWTPLHLAVGQGQLYIMFYNWAPKCMIELLSSLHLQGKRRLQSIWSKKVPTSMQKRKRNTRHFTLPFCLVNRLYA